MTRWRRTSEMAQAQEGPREETWGFWKGEAPIASYQVQVTFGKALDVRRLKGVSMEEIAVYARELERNAQRMYGGEAALVEISQCPCCGSEDHGRAGAVFGVPYAQCSGCGHVFVKNQSPPEVLQSAFVEDESYAVFYTDPATVETRLAQVIAPKVAWMQAVYHQQMGSSPGRVLDIGAGGGHFLEGVRRAGMDGAGYEISKAACEFAHNVFGITLSQEDFLSAAIPAGAFDVITFWGLLEYTPSPRAFLQAARQRLQAGKGLLVVEVPRYDCLSTAVQLTDQAVIARHLDPTSHVNCFTDDSLCTVLYQCGFKPVAAWYFGMDAYELIIQEAIRSNTPGLIDAFASWIPILQAALDRGRESDDLIIAAMPR